MNRADALSNEKPGRFVPGDVAPEAEEVAPEADAPWEADAHYGGVSLAPTTLDSLVTWDVSGHARRDQERVSSAAAQIPSATLPDS